AGTAVFICTLIYKSILCDQFIGFPSKAWHDTEFFNPQNNVALHGKATQSHRLKSEFSMDANNAIDGNRNSDLTRGSCTHTGSQAHPWWRVDLLESYIITSISVTNRGDCCSENINGAGIHIGNSLQDDGRSNPDRCAVISTIAPGFTQNFQCNGMDGRYINIVIPARVEYLVLCEVEVYASRLEILKMYSITRAMYFCTPHSRENLAIYGKATQSTLYSVYVAYNAIDGNRAANIAKHSCSITANEFNPWWRLDLGKTHKVFSIKITNRIEDYTRINGAEIRIGDSLDNNGNNNERCAVISTISPGFTETFLCNGMDGRYINVVVPGRTVHLHLCEVEVYGSSHISPDIMKYSLINSSSSFSLSIIFTEFFVWSLNQNNETPFSSACVASPDENLALRGKATQSNRLKGEWDSFVDASNAIDGNRNPDLTQGSCTHTGKQSFPWWRVDLLESYILTSISVTNRGDCCSENINGAEIHVGNSLQDHGTSNPMVAVISRIPLGRTLKITFSGHVEGRYVTVLQPGLNQVLTLCEVEVYGYHAPTVKTNNPLIHKDRALQDQGKAESLQSDILKCYFAGENVAFYGKATQSSLYETAIAYNAIDGNRAGLWEKASCTLTKYEFNPWWRLDLGRTHKVFSINISNRVEYHNRINGAEIRVGDSLDNNGNNNPRCAVISTIGPGFTETFQCNGMDGRYINVVIPGRTEHLSLSEVEDTGIAYNAIDGSRTGHSNRISCTHTSENVALHGKATQSHRIEHPFSSAYNAIDGNRQATYAAGSCTHTIGMTNPWWSVDLLDSYIVTSISVTNRGDCCPERLNGAEIHIGNSLLYNGAANPVCAVISTIAPGSTETYQCNGMDGRYINVFIPGRNEYLTLCEVEVYASQLD
uniref:Fucolectin tachylectin-4 pentraxin-1 domain-containing protein n=1 Tax=Poecilia formosa TaxID=48698 RepID=A0A087Y4N1_POEFO